MDSDTDDPIHTSNSATASQQLPQEEWAKGFAMALPVSWPKSMHDHPGMWHLWGRLGKSLKTRTERLLAVGRAYRLWYLAKGSNFPLNMQGAHMWGGGGSFASPLHLLSVIFTQQRHHFCFLTGDLPNLPNLLFWKRDWPGVNTWLLPW